MLYIQLKLSQFLRLSLIRIETFYNFCVYRYSELKRYSCLAFIVIQNKKKSYRRFAFTVILNKVDKITY